MPSAEGFQSSGRFPLRVRFSPQPEYKAYKSPYGPKVTHTPNLMGMSFGQFGRYAYLSSGFAVAAGVFAVFFFGEVPKVRNDILSKMPVIGDYFIREVPPEDNPF